MDLPTRAPTGVLITAAQLQRFAPSCDFLALGPALDRAARAHDIVTPRRLRHFMAHLHVESAGFTRLVENLNYSAERICVVWPRRFPTIEAAQPFAHNPEALAERVYGGRMGNVRPGDGWRYRGRGLIGLTFHANYVAAGKRCSLPLEADPDMAGQARVAAEIAASFWAAEGLNRIVDADDGECAIADVQAALRANEGDDLREATQAINGGQTGVADRMRQLLRAGLIWRE